MATTPSTTPAAATPTGAAIPQPKGRLATWRYVFNTANLPEGMTHPDAISKWLVITRAAVFSMTATSGLIGGLLAVGAAAADAARSASTGDCCSSRSSGSSSPTPRTT